MMVKVSFSRGWFLVPESLGPILNSLIITFLKQLPFKQQIPSPHPKSDLKFAIYLFSEENLGVTEQSMK